MKENKLPYHPDTGFKVPDGYFEDLQARVMDKVTSRHELELPEAQKPFKVPSDYFENFEDRLFKKLEPENNNSRIRRLFEKETLYYVAGVAAVFVAILTTFLTNDPQGLHWESLDVAILEDYLHENIENSSGEFTQLLGEEEFFPSSGTAELDQEAVMEYLHENIEDPSILLNEE